MIDEFWIQIAPVLLGKGKRLFEEGKYRKRLEFVETTQMGELTELHFRKITANKSNTR
jgi:dihydrofolate reductase